MLGVFPMTAQQRVEELLGWIRQLHERLTDELVETLWGQYVTFEALSGRTTGHTYWVVLNVWEQGQVAVTFALRSRHGSYPAATKVELAQRPDHTVPPVGPAQLLANRAALPEDWQEVRAGFRRAIEWVEALHADPTTPPPR